jgi:tetratricopeptide (TPR) repeat protein
LVAIARFAKWLLAVGVLLAAVALMGVVYPRVRFDPERLAADARAAAKAGRWAEAERLLNRIVNIRPQTFDDVVLRAEVELGLDRPDRAIQLLEALPESDAHAGRARFVAGQIEYRRNRARHAETLFLEALRLDPKLTLARRAIIFVYAMQARRADLNSQYRVLAEQEPLDYDDVFLWTSSFENLWVNETIRSHLEQYLAADPDDRVSRLALAGVLFKANELERAQALVQPLSDSDPDARELRARFALALQHDEKVRSLLDGGPADHVGLSLLRGHLSARLNDPAAAASQFRLVLRQEPDNLEAIQGLSVVLKQMGDEKGAAAFQKQADQWRHLRTLLQKSTVLGIQRDKTLLSQLGAACEAVGQIPFARAWYKLALVQDPLDTSLQQTLYRLRDRP